MTNNTPLLPFDPRTGKLILSELHLREATTQAATLRLQTTLQVGPDKVLVDIGSASLN